MPTCWGVQPWHLVGHCSLLAHDSTPHRTLITYVTLNLSVQRFHFFQAFLLSTSPLSRSALEQTSAKRDLKAFQRRCAQRNVEPNTHLPPFRMETRKLLNCPPGAALTAA